MLLYCPYIRPKSNTDRDVLRGTETLRDNTLRTGTEFIQCVDRSTLIELGEIFCARYALCIQHGSNNISPVKDFNRADIVETRVTEQLRETGIHCACLWAIVGIQLHASAALLRADWT